MNNESILQNVIKFILLVRLCTWQKQVLVSDKSAGKLSLHEVQSEPQLIQLESGDTLEKGSYKD